MEVAHITVSEAIKMLCVMNKPKLKYLFSDNFQIH